MAASRRIRLVDTSRPAIEGAGVHLRRAIGWGRPKLYDPFLLLDDFRSDEPALFEKGFPWHPHRGIETITYVLRGKVEHGDSLGNSGVIGPGDVQWMTAGSGIIHQEMPKGDEDGVIHGFQLWANLPAASKMMEPRYRGIVADDIPDVTDVGGASIKVIAGSAGGVIGPVRDVVISPEVLDVSLSPGTSFDHRTPRGHTVFAYIIGGRGLFCQQRDPFSYEVVHERYCDTENSTLFGDGQLVLFGDGDVVKVSAEDDPLRFLLISGKPLGEPVAWRGPIVMNTQQELRVAYDELAQGTFIKHGGPPKPA